MNFEAICKGGPLDGKRVTQPESAYEFIVETIEMGHTKRLGRYIRQTYPRYGRLWFEWLWEDES